MHKILFTVITLSLVGLLSCSSESGGGSDAPGTDLEGSWEGAMVAFDVEGVENERDPFSTDFKYFGSGPSDGSLSNPVQFDCVPPECDFTMKNCPGVAPILSGTQRGEDIVGNLNGTEGDFITWTLKVVASDRIEGTYEYSDDSNPDCAGTTGVVTIDRI
jgi:hypothetical protein